MPFRSSVLSLGALALGALALGACGSTSSSATPQTARPVATLTASYSSLQQSTAIRLNGTMTDESTASGAHKSIVETLSGVFSQAKNPSQAKGEMKIAVGTSGDTASIIFVGGQLYLHMPTTAAIPGVSKQWIEIPMSQYLSNQSASTGSSPVGMSSELALIKAAIESHVVVTPNQVVNGVSTTRYSFVVTPQEMMKVLSAVEPSIAAHVKTLNGVVSDYRCSVWLNSSHFPVEELSTVDMPQSHSTMVTNYYLAPQVTPVSVTAPPAGQVQVMPSISAFLSQLQ